MISSRNAENDLTKFQHPFMSKTEALNKLGIKENFLILIKPSLIIANIIQQSRTLNAFPPAISNKASLSVLTTCTQHCTGDFTQTKTKDKKREVKPSLFTEDAVVYTNNLTPKEATTNY